MPRILTIMFLVLTPVLMSVIYFRDSAIGETFGEVVVWLTAILLAVTGSYYTWIKPKNRSKRWLIPPVLVAVFIIPFLIVMVKILVVGESPSETHIAVQKLTEAEEELRESDFETLASYTYRYESIIDEELEFMVYEWAGFPPLAVFHRESREIWKDYISLRSNHHFDTYILDALSRKYEINIPELDAVLFLWGKESTLETTEAAEIVVAMCRYYDIPKTMIHVRMSERELWELMLLPPIESELEKRIEDFGWRKRFGY